jgi:hypothetical protein
MTFMQLPGKEPDTKAGEDEDWGTRTFGIPTWIIIGVIGVILLYFLLCPIWPFC